MALIFQPGAGLGQGHLGALVLAGGILTGDHYLHRAEIILAGHGVQSRCVIGQGGKMQELQLPGVVDLKHHMDAVFKQGNRLHS